MPNLVVFVMVCRYYYEYFGLLSLKMAKNYDYLKYFSKDFCRHRLSNLYYLFKTLEDGCQEWDEFSISSQTIFVRGCSIIMRYMEGVGAGLQMVNFISLSPLRVIYMRSVFMIIIPKLARLIEKYISSLERRISSFNPNLHGGDADHPPGTSRAISPKLLKLALQNLLTFCVCQFRTIQASLEQNRRYR